MDRCIICGRKTNGVICTQCSLKWKLCKGHCGIFYKKSELTKGLCPACYKIKGEKDLSL